MFTADTSKCDNTISNDDSSLFLPPHPPSFPFVLIISSHLLLAVFLSLSFWRTSQPLFQSHRTSCRGVTKPSLQFAHFHSDSLPKIFHQLNLVQITSSLLSLPQRVTASSQLFFLSNRVMFAGLEGKCAAPL